MNIARTESQVIKGKLAYMAPEQAAPRNGVALDRRADIFAMGIVLWEDPRRDAPHHRRRPLRAHEDRGHGLSSPLEGQSRTCLPELDATTAPRARAGARRSRYPDGTRRCATRSRASSARRASSSARRRSARLGLPPLRSGARGRAAADQRSTTPAIRVVLAAAILLQEETARTEIARSVGARAFRAPARAADERALVEDAQPGLSRSPSRCSSLRAGCGRARRTRGRRGGDGLRGTGRDGGDTPRVRGRRDPGLVKAVRATRTAPPGVSRLDPASTEGGGAALAASALTRLTVRVEPEGADGLVATTHRSRNPLVGTFERDERRAPASKVTCTGYAPGRRSSCASTVTRSRKTSKLDKLDGAPALGASPGAGVVCEGRRRRSVLPRLPPAPRRRSLARANRAGVARETHGG